MLHLTAVRFLLSHDMRFPTMWYVRSANAQTSLRICAVWSESLLVAWIFYKYQATDRTLLGVSKLKRRLHRLVWVYTCKNLPHCWKSHVAAHVEYAYVFQICGSRGVTTDWRGNTVIKVHTCGPGRKLENNRSMYYQGNQWRSMSRPA